MRSLYFSAVLAAVFGSSPVPAQNRSLIEMTGSYPFQYLVIDPSGRKTGEDPRYLKNDGRPTLWEEIPDVNYGTEAVGDSPTDDVPLATDISHKLLGWIQSPDGDGRYKILCIGLTESSYELYLTIRHNDSGKKTYYRSQSKGIIQKDSVVEYEFEYHGATNSFVPLTKQVTFSILRNDINSAFSLTLLGDEQLRDKLLSYVDKCEKILGKKEDSSKVAAELSQLSKDLSKEREETIKHEERKQKDKRFIGKDAFDILSEDVRLLLARFASLN